jgi:mannosyl-3-phosphoglycerate phosphatase
MDVEEVVELTGLPEMEARLALKRYHSEPFLLEEGDPGAVLREIEGMGLRWTSGGRFYHILGQNDKGKAVHLLSEIYKDNAKDVHWVTIGVGDSLNDLPMLEAVDKAVLLKGPQGTLDQEVIRLGRSDMLYGEGGPRGWAEVLTKLILQYCPVK